MARLTERLIAQPLQLDLTWEHDRLAGAHVLFSPSDVREPSCGISPYDSQAAKPLSEQGQMILRELAAYVNGQKPSWPDISLSMEGLSPFAAQVLQTLRTRVDYGSTITYGQLAALCGRPNAARAVGGIMARNPWPLLVPCHRVLGAKGALTGFSGGGGLELKAWLLRREGCVCDEQNLRLLHPSNYSS